MAEQTAGVCAPGVTHFIPAARCNTRMQGSSGLACNRAVWLTSGTPGTNARGGRRRVPVDRLVCTAAHSLAHPSDLGQGRCWKGPPPVRPALLIQHLCQPVSGCATCLPPGSHHHMAGWCGLAACRCSRVGVGVWREQLRGEGTSQLTLGSCRGRGGTCRLLCRKANSLGAGASCR
jgi:hypothetical protein